MGEWLSNNVLLPIMYLFIDIGVAFAVLLLAMHLLEKIISSNVFEKIRR
jgi:formate-dependent nitrite reductase membrane component NrfD